MRPTNFARSVLLTAALSVVAAAHAERARDLGIPMDGAPGPLNAITDIAGVEVGHATLIRGEGQLVPGRGPVRTGVTAVLPRGKHSTTPVFAAWATSNAAGEMTGTVWLEERGILDGPIMITNTHSVGVVRDAAVKWMVDRNWKASWHAPVVAETFDGRLNDINGYHVRQEDALRALSEARGGPVPEGNVGGGTGMICSQFKGGIGTSSRTVNGPTGKFMVGALVQCNYGSRPLLRIAGVPVGRLMKDRLLPCFADVQPSPPAGAPTCAPDSLPPGRDGSIIVVLATDAPLLPHQLKRVAKRPALAMGRLGDIGGEGSGDIFIAFSTANANLQSTQRQILAIEAFPNNELTPIFEAAVQATEEAIVNALLAAETMTGRDGFRVHGIPHDELRSLFGVHRLQEKRNCSSQRARRSCP